MRNQPVISTAKVRGLIKKNGIGYVNERERLFEQLADGVSVWQLCSSVYFKVYGYDYNEEKRQEYLAKFVEVLAKEGFAVLQGSSDSAFQIVKGEVK